MELKKKICKGRGKYNGFGCGELKYIFSHGCCRECSNKALLSNAGCKVYDNDKSAKKQRYERKTTGYLALFDEIWNEREHISQISGFKLLPKGHPKWHWQFSHIIESPYKGYGFPLRKDNVFLCLPEEHTLYGEQTHRAKKDDRFSWVFKKKVELILEYNDIKRQNKYY